MPDGFRHQLAHDGLGRAFWKIGKLREAENEIKLAIKWAEKKQQSAARFYTLLGWFYIDWIKSKPHWSEAIKAFEAAKDEDPDYFGNYWGIGRALFEQGFPIEAANNLRMVIDCKPDLQPPASEEINALLDQCKQKIKTEKQ